LSGQEIDDRLPDLTLDGKLNPNFSCIQFGNALAELEELTAIDASDQGTWNWTLIFTCANLRFSEIAALSAGSATGFGPSDRGYDIRMLL
jgi:hypothetical protein